MKPGPRLTLFLFFLGIILTDSFCSASNFSKVDWKDLTDQNLTETGQTALRVYGEAWLHAETEHFVYHFHDAKEAETILVHAEVYYQWIKQMFGITEDPEKNKSHVFIFDDKDLWRSFSQNTMEKLPGAEAFTNGRELFIYRMPFWLEPQRVLAHEITHLVMFRFVKGRIPLFLNEAFAEFMATKAIAMKADGNDFNVRTFKLIPETEFIPLDELSDFKNYPSEKIEIFYRQCEFLARFLILNYKPEKFYSLLKLTANGTPFMDAIEELYGIDLETFAQKFKTYAMTR